MSLRELVVGSTQMLVESVLRRINENLLNYFINLPESIWLSGFLDQVNLKDVMFNTRAFSNEWYSLDIPFRLKYGHIRRASIQVLLAHSKLVMEVDGVVLIVGPNLAYKSYEDVIRNSMDNVFGLVELFKHIQTIRYNKDSFGENLGSQKEEVSDNLLNINSSSKEGLNALLRWLFRYVPDLSLSIRNLYIRYEDDVLDTSHPMSAGIHIDSVTINPARNCWEFQWPTEEKEQVGFTSKSSSDFEVETASPGKQHHPLSITNSSADPRGIFSIKIKGLSAFLDDESAPFIPISLLEQTEASNDKFGVFSAVTIDDIQNLVNSNLQYHTRIISNLNVSSQFGFVNPFIQRFSNESGSQTTGSSSQKSSAQGQAPCLNSSSAVSKNTNSEKNGYIENDYLSDYYTGSNIATLLNINIHSGLEINVYPQMIHGLVRFVTLYNQFQFWTQVRRFRPIERPGSGKTPAEVRAICREWWIFSLKYYRNIKYKDKHNSLKDEINYRIERKKYIKIIKKWKWVEFMITGQKPISDSGTIIHRTGTDKQNACSFGGGLGTAMMCNVDDYADSMGGSSISFLDSNLSSALGLNSQIISHLRVTFNLSRYWKYDVEVLQKISEKSEDMKCILAVLQHHTYWVVSQWHVLAEREFEIELALLQNSSTGQKKYTSGGATDVFSGVGSNMDVRTKNNLTLLSYGLHIQMESSVWELINTLRESYSGFIRKISQDEGLSRRIKESLHHKSSILNGGSVFELGLTSGISTGVPTQISSFIQENVERHPYVVFGSGIFRRGSFETEVLSDFFGVGLNPGLMMTRRDWHSIRLRLHLWGRFYDEYFEAFPLAISETVEISQLMNLSYHLDFQQMNNLFSISMQNDSLCFSSLLSSQAVVSSPMEDLGVANVTVARPKSQNLSASERRDQDWRSPLLSSSSATAAVKLEEKKGETLHSGEIKMNHNQIPGIDSKLDVGLVQEGKEHSSNESNEMVEDESVVGNMSSAKKKTFMFEKRLPNVYNDSSNVPEWLSDLAGPGIALPKIISNKIIGICSPKFEINICHLVSGNKRSAGQTNTNTKSTTGNNAGTNVDNNSGVTGSNTSTTEGGGGSKRSYHSLARYFTRGHHDRNVDIATTAFTPRKLFGIVVTDLGFNMSTCTSLRMSSCFKRMEIVVWNYNDSNLMREFTSSIKLDNTVNKKMIRDDQIVIFSLCGERLGTRNASQDRGLSGSGSRLGGGEPLEMPIGGYHNHQTSSHTEQTTTEGADGNKDQTPNRRRNSLSLNEYDASPSLIHDVDETQSGSFSPSITEGGRKGGNLLPAKSVRFEDHPKGERTVVPASSSASGMVDSSSLASLTFETLKVSNSDLNSETSLTTNINGIKNDHLNTSVPLLINTNNNNNNMSGLSRYMKRWNYMSLVVLPPNNSSGNDRSGEMRGTGDTSLSFVFKLPFYLKMDVNLTAVTIVLNELLLDNIRGEIMKLVQVCLLTIWSQYKGLGAFPVNNTIWESMHEGVSGVRNHPREENGFELLLCHPFNLSLNKYNSLNRMNTKEWNRINSLLNKVHARISIILPLVEVYMLNESIEYFHQREEMEERETLLLNEDLAEKNISFDLSTSFKFLVESQTVLIGTIIDKLRGNMNRLYFRGFQMKFDTQQNITSIIRLYLRFKNLISERYGNIIAIMNLFKDYRFDLISRHSLTSFTDEILRLQCEKLPDTNNILLKEFTLSLGEKPDFEPQKGEKAEDEQEWSRTPEHVDSVTNACSSEDAKNLSPAKIPVKDPATLHQHSPTPASPSMKMSPSISPSQVPSPFMSPALLVSSAYSVPYHSSHYQTLPNQASVSSSSEVPASTSGSLICVDNPIYGLDVEKQHSEAEVSFLNSCRQNNYIVDPKHLYEDHQIRSELNTICENIEIRRKSSKLVFIRDEAEEVLDRHADKCREDSLHQPLEREEEGIVGPQQAGKQANLVSLAGGETISRKSSQQSSLKYQCQLAPHKPSSQKKPPISLRSGFSFNN